VRIGAAHKNYVTCHEQRLLAIHRVKSLSLLDPKNLGKVLFMGRSGISAIQCCSHDMKRFSLLNKFGPKKALHKKYFYNIKESFLKGRRAVWVCLYLTAL
jgi:hypothetical protein